MKKKVSRRSRNSYPDTMRPEYDFSSAIRGITAARYAQGTNIAVIDPAVLDVFPDSAAVNQTLRALAPVLRKQRQAAAKRRTACCIKKSVLNRDLGAGLSESSSSGTNPRQI